MAAVALSEPARSPSWSRFAGALAACGKSMHRLAHSWQRILCLHSMGKKRRIPRTGPGQTRAFLGGRVTGRALWPVTLGVAGGGRQPLIDDGTANVPQPIFGARRAVRRKVPGVPCPSNVAPDATGALVFNIMAAVDGVIANRILEMNGSVGGLSTTAPGAVNTGAILSGVRTTIIGIAGGSGVAAKNGSSSAPRSRGRFQRNDPAVGQDLPVLLAKRVPETGNREKAPGSAFFSSRRSWLARPSC